MDLKCLAIYPDASLPVKHWRANIEEHQNCNEKENREQNNNQQQAETEINNPLEGEITWNWSMCGV